MGFRTIRCATSIAFLAGTAVAQGTLFPVNYPYPVGDAPFGSALADVNADGNLDYLVANCFATDVSVLLGTGTGQFNQLPPVTVGGEPRSLVVADLNGDNKLDLVTVNSTTDCVSVLLGNGFGGFGAPTTFTTSIGSFPVSVDAGDVDGDGDIDVVTGNQATNNLSVLRGNGAGALGAPSTHNVGSTPERIRLADMNGDGRLDCVTALSSESRVCVSLAAANGNLIAFTDKFVPSPRGLAVGDVNADGRPDVAVSSALVDMVSVFLGSGNGGLLAPKEYWIGPGNYHSTAVVFADASGDGRPDLISCNGGTTKSMTVWVNIGGGDFGFTLTSPMQEVTYDAVAADLNGDGRADVVTSHLLQDLIRVHIGAGVGDWEQYCTAKTNSQGCVPFIWGEGTPSVSNPRPFWVYVTRVLDAKPGLFLYTVNGSQTSIPFQGGTLCIGPAGIRRTPSQTSGTYPEFPSPNCEGKYRLNWNAFAAGLSGGNPHPGLLVLGNSYQLQVWSRDPGFAQPNNTGLSAALDVTPWL